MKSPFSLEGKTILVTGASSGIGKRTAVECSKLGANIIISGRNQERLDETFSLLSYKGTIIKADLNIQDDLDQLLEIVPSLDGLVLSSGKGILLPVQSSTKKKFEDTFETNLFSPVELLRQLIKRKKFNDGASIVSVASVGGTHLYTIGNGIYGASKAALDSYMKFCARELAPKKIRVNTVLPGMIDTPFIHGGAVSDEMHKQNMENFPLKRYGTPEDVAYAIIYLLSDASSWVTGTSLVIDGGRSLV